MEIRFATKADEIHIIRSIQNKHINFITPTHLKRDISNREMIIAIENGKIVGGLSIVDEPRFGYHAIKRACVYNKKNHGKGIMSELFAYALSLGYSAYGCTPWEENTVILHYMHKFNFVYQYTVHQNYLVYAKTDNNP